MPRVDSHLRLQDAVEHGVLRGDEVVVLPALAGAEHEAVVHHAVGHAVVVVGEQPRRLGLLRIADVVPQHRRLVALDQLAPVGVGVAGVLRRSAGWQPRKLARLSIGRPWKVQSMPPE